MPYFRFSDSWMWLCKYVWQILYWRLHLSTLKRALKLFEITLMCATCIVQPDREEFPHYKYEKINVRAGGVNDFFIVICYVCKSWGGGILCSRFK